MQRLLMFVIFFLLLTACSLLTTQPTGESGLEGKTVVVTPAIQGNSAELNVGDTLEIRFPTIPSEGFEWQVVDLDSAILVQEGDAEYLEDDDLDSAGGVVIVRFKAVGVGQTHLSLAYVSGGSGDTPSFSKDTFGMMVIVE